MPVLDDLLEHANVLERGGDIQLVSEVHRMHHVRVLVVPGSCTHGLVHEGMGVQRAIRPLGNGHGWHISGMSKVCMLMHTLLLVMTMSCVHTTVTARAILLLPLRVLLI